MLSTVPTLPRPKGINTVATASRRCGKRQQMFTPSALRRSIKRQRVVPALKCMRPHIYIHIYRKLYVTCCSSATSRVPSCPSSLNKTQKKRVDLATAEPDCGDESRQRAPGRDPSAHPSACPRCTQPSPTQGSRKENLTGGKGSPNQTCHKPTKSLPQPLLVSLAQHGCQRIDLGNAALATGDRDITWRARVGAAAAVTPNRCPATLFRLAPRPSCGAVGCPSCCPVIGWQPLRSLVSWLSLGPPAAEPLQSRNRSEHLASP